jgi:predicted nucleic acid-binding protein
MARYAYLDASALVKLVAAERETAALENDLAQRDGILSSRLSVAEVTRAVRRAGNRKLLQRLEDVFESLVLIDVSAPLINAAGQMLPAELRTLDAIHLATALSVQLGPLDSVDVITYDRRLEQAATRAGLAVERPA